MKRLTITETLTCSSSSGSEQLAVARVSPIWRKLQKFKEGPICRYSIYGI